MLNKEYPVDKCHCNTNDALESNQDLGMLFEVLKSVHGRDGKPAILTAIYIVANRDFKKIRDSDFKKYHYEPFSETLKRYPEHDKVMDLYQEGISQGVIMPQFHGREHLNVNRWMRALNKDWTAEKEAFDMGVFSPKIAQSTGFLNEYKDALDFKSTEDLAYQKSFLFKVLTLFNKI